MKESDFYPFYETDGYAEIMKAIEDAEPRWVSVEDRLPEDEREYLVYKGWHDIAVYTKKG